MSEAEWWFYTVIQSGFGLLLLLVLHWIIPIIIIIVSNIYFRKKSKRIRNTICIIVIIATVLSYFTVGYIAKAPIYVDETTNIQGPIEDVYFHIEDYENNFQYDGQVYWYEKSKFDLEDVASKAFANDEIFPKILSPVYKELITTQALSKKAEIDGYMITISPVVVAPRMFPVGRHIYHGFVMIEDEENVFFIPYKFNIFNSLSNDIFFTRIYSKSLRVNLEDVM